MIELGLRAIVENFENMQVRFLVVGELAVLAHGCMPYTDKIVLSLAFGAESGAFAETMRGLWRGSLVVHAVTYRQMDFDAMYKRAEQFELRPGVQVPVCSYLDLVKSKRHSADSKDMVDLDHLEKVRRPRPAVHDPWYECTFEGNELWSLWRWSDLTFSEKIRSLEGSLELGRMFQKARK